MKKPKTVLIEFCKDSFAGKPFMSAFPTSIGHIEWSKKCIPGHIRGIAEASFIKGKLVSIKLRNDLL